MLLDKYLSVLLRQEEYFMCMRFFCCFLQLLCTSHLGFYPNSFAVSWSWPNFDSCFQNVTDDPLPITVKLMCCCCSVADLCLILCEPMDCSTLGFPVLHHLLEFAQTHAHWVDDAIQPSHPLSFLSPPAFNLSQHQDLFQRALWIRWPKYWSFSISPSNEYSLDINMIILQNSVALIGNTLKK